MNPYPTVNEEFFLIQPEDLWVYNKLQLSRLLNYNCGVAGVSVPKEDDYIIRPMMNVMGMGRQARISHLIHSTTHLHPSEFWGEIFTGPHYSVDYENTSQVLCVEGVHDSSDSLERWKMWRKIDKQIPFPEILSPVSEKYSLINCEFIGNSLIEVQLRHNPDFRYENEVAIPVYQDEEYELQNHQRYVYDPDCERTGFIVY
jgi:hypothetical protein